MRKFGFIEVTTVLTAFSIFVIYFISKAKELEDPETFTKVALAFIYLLVLLAASYIIYRGTREKEALPPKTDLKSMM